VKLQLHSFSTSATDGGKANFITDRYSPRKRAPVPTEEKVGWVAESIWSLRLDPDGNQTTNARSSANSVVSILPTLCRLRDITVVSRFDNSVFLTYDTRKKRSSDNQISQSINLFTVSDATLNTEDVCVCVCFPGVTTHCGALSQPSSKL
jgi:hypothetical protein